MSATAWLTIGLLAQGLFSARFVVQWIASERAGESVVPVAFWHLSIAGSALLLAYAVRRQDPVFILGQVTGLLVYGRNLSLIRRPRRPRRPHAAPPAGRPEPLEAEVALRRARSA